MLLLYIIILLLLLHVVVAVVNEYNNNSIFKNIVFKYIWYLLYETNSTTLSFYFPTYFKIGVLSVTNTTTISHKYRKSKQIIMLLFSVKINFTHHCDIFFKSFLICANSSVVNQFKSYFAKIGSLKSPFMLKSAFLGLNSRRLTKIYWRRPGLLQSWYCLLPRDYTQ